MRKARFPAFFSLNKVAHQDRASEADMSETGALAVIPRPSGRVRFAFGRHMMKGRRNSAEAPTRSGFSPDMSGAINGACPPPEFAVKAIRPFGRSRVHFLASPAQVACGPCHSSFPMQMVSCSLQSKFDLSLARNCRQYSYARPQDLGQLSCSVGCARAEAAEARSATAATLSALLILRPSNYPSRASHRWPTNGGE